MSLQAITNQIVRETLQKIKDRTGKDVRIDDIEWSNRMTRTWGIARLYTYNGERRYKILLAAKRFTKDSLAFRNTVIHEIAHLADYQIYNNWGHGPTWKGLMRILGQTPTRLTTPEELASIDPFPKRKITKYQYTCSCTTHHLSGQLHARALQGWYRICVKCKGRLSFTGITQRM